ncbi:MAG: phosphoadenylyl-sulfate reductase [Planctomycetes bacterium]|nr:phosphoadenylyl-sulfate reductase [Planctomycetota bacterium]
MAKEQKSSSLEHLKTELAGYSAQDLLGYFLRDYQGKVAFSSSMAAEDQVLTDMICKIKSTTEIFTLDTGRLPQETYDVIEKTNDKYDINIRMMFPDSRLIEQMLLDHGPNSFYHSLENRKNCCHIRKIEPLKRALKDVQVWICGLRKEQSVTREDLEPIQWDSNFNVIKLSPLLDWTTEQVWDYIRENKVPYNALHDKGYPSIGCAPCTRAVEDGQDIRAGRWWWEKPEHKECGLHLK